MPMTSRDFQKAAFQRWTSAQVLFEKGRTLDAIYLGGYTIECSLKALILETTSPANKPLMLQKISSGKKMHEAEVLGAILKDSGRTIPLSLARRYRRFGWSTALRYQAARKPVGEARGFLKTVKAIYDWVEGQLP